MATKKISADKKRVTLKDVALRSGVAVPTASLVLSATPGIRVAAATAARVHRAAAELGYTPHFATKLLQGKETGILALCLAGPRVAKDEPARDLVQALGECLSQGGRKQYLHRFGDKPVAEVAALMEQGAQAFVFAGDPPQYQEVIGYLDGHGIPWMGYACSLSRNVRADVQGGVADLVRAARARGLKHFAAVLPDPRAPRIPCERWAGLKLGLGREPPLVITEEISNVDEDQIVESARSATIKALALLPRPEIIFYHTDLCASGGIRAVLEAGLTPGKEIAVCGVGDSALARHGAYPFPSVRFDPPAMARAILELMNKSGRIFKRVPAVAVLRSLRPAGK